MEERPRIVAYRSCPVQPWRNGRGLLRSVAQGPGWQLRLAEITRSGPFSDYTGSLRLFAIVQGAVRLRMPSGDVYDCDPHSPAISFYGGAPPDCKLVGGAPAQALNFIVDPALTAARLDRHAVGSEPLLLSLSGGRLIAIHAQSGEVACGALRIARQDTLVSPPSTGLQLTSAVPDAQASHGPERAPAVVLVAWLVPVGSLTAEPSRVGPATAG